VLLNTYYFDGMIELRLKFMHTGCPALKAHISIVCGRPCEKFVHPCRWATTHLLA